jgi:dual specificity MAP kinase phosphatase
MARCPMGHLVGPVPVIIDCRPFMEYNKSHIQGAVHINCSDKISRRRLQQGKITVLDLLSCRESSGKDSFKSIFSKEIVVYDENTMDPQRVTSLQPLHVVLDSLRREGKDPIVLKGRTKFWAHIHKMSQIR